MVFRERKIENGDLEVMSTVLEAIAHRGPDGSGVWHSNRIALGHRRLSIIDLSPSGAQPLHREDLGLHITFNGEIYNYKELRMELSSRGHSFRTSTDTEVILVSYIHFGDEFVSQLRGMFAFILYDERNQKVILARDRMGKKPLHYILDEHRVLISSDIKTFHAYPDQALDIDAESVKAYFALQFIPGPFTIYKQVRRLAPGTILTLDLRRWQVSEHRYWDREHCSTSTENDLPPAPRVAQALAESVRYRLIADVDVGVLMSGGIDSSLIAFLAREVGGPGLKGFSVEFSDPSLDESTIAASVAKMASIDLMKLSAQTITPDLLFKTVYHCGEPLGDPACIPTYLISELLSKHVKVVLSGEGADELFWGYPHYIQEMDYRMLVRSQGLFASEIGRRVFGGLENAPHLPSAISRATKVLTTSGALGVLRWVTVFGEPALDRLMGKTYSTSGPRYRSQIEDVFSRNASRTNSIDAAIAVDMAFWLPDDLLLKVDRMSMAHGVEVRTPFLDHTLAELSLTLPRKLKIDGHTTKVVLRKLLAEKLRPHGATMIAERKKHGFETPFRDWMSNELKELADDHLLSPSPEYAALLNREYTRNMWQSYVKHGGTKSFSRKVWLLLTYSVWLEQHKNRFGLA